MENQFQGLVGYYHILNISCLYLVINMHLSECREMLLQLLQCDK